MISWSKKYNFKVVSGKVHFKSEDAYYKFLDGIDEASETFTLSTDFPNDIVLRLHSHDIINHLDIYYPFLTYLASCKDGRISKENKAKINKYLFEITDYPGCGH